MTHTLVVGRGSFFATALMILLGFSAPPAFAQDCDGNVIELGPVANTTGSWAVLASETVTVDPAWRSARLFFKSDEVLPGGSYLRITSLDDMTTQVLTSSELGEWRHSSAYFNAVAPSNQLLLELVCAPHTSGNYIKAVEMCKAPAIGSNAACNLCVPEPPVSSV